MFQHSGLFSQILCPDGERCRLLNCIFKHSHVLTGDTRTLRADHARATAKDANGAKGSDGPPKKKQKISPEPQNDMATEGTLSRAAVQRKPSKPEAVKIDSKSQSPLASMHRRISPPPAKAKALGTDSRKVAELKGEPHGELPSIKAETLNPRMVPKAPASHAIRTRLLRLMHEQMQRLNEELKASSGLAKDELRLSSQELIKTALDEEEHTARSNVSVYPNVLKLRIMALKKMKLQAWIEERRKRKESAGASSKPRKPKKVETGLTAQEEIALLPRLVTSQEKLAPYGYVTAQIADEDIENARKGLESAHGYEMCDRCGSRFQVFPGRREDGSLTTGGTCTYHPGRLRRSASGGSSSEQRYTCCQDAAGSVGCETAEHHVFKASDPKRLALVLPFKETETVGPRVPTGAVCFDCEMGYTTMGMELIRLTATDWPSGEELLDVLVRPVGEVLDLNSRFSGVWPEDYTKATPYGEKESQTEGAGSGLSTVSSPAAARDLLHEYLTTSTPLIGHALENDLNSVRIIHPTIIDTVALFPHPRGLPYRLGLKSLMKEHLDADIQTGGAQGHDSKEDARAAGELVRLKIAETWKRLRTQGWTVSDGEFIPPKPS